MPRAPSIPDSLIEPILNRAMMGQSAQQIADWIAETNDRRKVPVHTSRASVQRLLASVGSKARYSKMIAVQRVWAQSLDAADTMEFVSEEYFRVLKEAPSMELCRPDVKAHFSRSMRALNAASVLAERRLRIAGCLSRAADQLLDQHAEEIEAARARVIAENKAAGLPVYEPPPPSESIARIDSPKPLETSANDSSRIRTAPAREAVPAPVRPSSTHPAIPPETERLRPAA